ncbi:MAG TPA: hypothetical protein VGB13_11050, partial [Candidatus Krumholzibacteria bacterium]
MNDGEREACVSYPDPAFPLESTRKQATSLPCSSPLDAGTGFVEGGLQSRHPKQSPSVFVELTPKAPDMFNLPPRQNSKVPGIGWLDLTPEGGQRLVETLQQV